VLPIMVSESTSEPTRDYIGSTTSFYHPNPHNQTSCPLAPLRFSLVAMTMPQFTSLPVEVQTMVIDLALPATLIHAIKSDKHYHATISDLRNIANNLTIAYPATIDSILHVLRKRGAEVQAALAALPGLSTVFHHASCGPARRCRRFSMCKNAARRGQTLRKLAFTLHELQVQLGLRKEIMESFAWVSGEGNSMADIWNVHISSLVDLVVEHPCRSTLYKALNVAVIERPELGAEMMKITPGSPGLLVATHIGLALRRENYTFQKSRMTCTTTKRYKIKTTSAMALPRTIDFQLHAPSLTPSLPFRSSIDLPLFTIMASFISLPVELQSKSFNTPHLSMSTNHTSLSALMN
jgi:hypothetical protein